MYIIEPQHLEEWTNPYQSNHVHKLYHRDPHIIWNANNTMTSVSSNGYTVYYHLRGLRLHKATVGGDLNSYRTEYLTHMALSAMAASVIIRAFKKYKSTKLRRRGLTLIHCIQNKVIPEHNFEIFKLLNISHCSGNERGDGIKSLRRAKRNKKLPYLQALITTLYPKVESTPVVGYRCDISWNLDRMCYHCIKYHFGEVTY